MDIQRTLFERFNIINISRRSRTISLILISLAMMAIIVNFHMANAQYAKTSVLPVYIIFFVLMYLCCVVVEYFSLWCDRGMNFHYSRLGVHALALILVTYETGAFYGSNKDAYSQLPSYSLTSALSHVVVAPSIIDESGI